VVLDCDKVLGLEEAPPLGHGRVGVDSVVLAKKLGRAVLYLAQRVSPVVPARSSSLLDLAHARPMTLLRIVAVIDAIRTALVVVSAVERAECAILVLESPLLTLEKNKLGAAVIRFKEVQALPVRDLALRRGNG
jgi:hypothetical protein